MKKNSGKIKLICALLLAAMLLAALSSAAASGGFYIDDSLFTTYEKDHVTVWYWRPGIPPADQNGTKYPILLTWDNNKYFWNINGSFFQSEEYYSDLRSHANALPLYSAEHPDLRLGYDNGLFPYSWIGTGGWVGNPIDYPKGYFHGYYKPQNAFSASSEGLTAKLPFNLNAIVQAGSGISLEKPDLPYVVGRGEETEGSIERSFFYMGIEVPESLSGTYKRYVRSDHRYAWLGTEFKWTERYTNDNPLLFAGSQCFFNWSFQPFFSDSLTDFSSIYYKNDTTPYQMDKDGNLVDFEPDKWMFWRRSSGSTQFPEYTYMISNDGFLDLETIGDISSTHTTYDFDDWLDAFTSIGERRSCGLQWSGSNFIMQGNRGAIGLQEGAEGSFRFTCFYATPVIMDIIQTSFVVENGQVLALDGPVIIGENCTITVKEGGTLAITAKSEQNGVDLGWVMNNGKIVVEEGGTLYVQNGACLNKYNNKKSNGGGVICRGLCIVDENAKLCGGGVDGLQFLAGSHVVNYGALISENFTVSADHTIENRGSGAFVFHGKGNGVIGSGYSLFAGKVTSDGYPERGTVETAVNDSIAPGGIYSW